MIVVRHCKADIAGAGVNLYLGPRTCFWLRRQCGPVAIPEGVVAHTANKARGPGWCLRAPTPIARPRRSLGSARLDAA